MTSLPLCGARAFARLGLVRALWRRMVRAKPCIQADFWE
jgi:hypothetical protein